MDDRSATAPSPRDDAMAAYYARRAVEYERIYAKPERQADLRSIEAWLPTAFAGRRVLEIACGTGWWTMHGARDAKRWLATDLNPETMAIAQAKPLPRSVALRAADAYTLVELGDETFDAAFAGCWWSHVPKARLAPWLATLHQRLEPGARVVVLDNLYVPGSSTPIARRDDAGNTYQWRTLADGSRHEVLKNFPAPQEAIAALGPHARDAQWLPFTYYWVLSWLSA
jgi:SAM-dependent methyltransferase